MPDFQWTSAGGVLLDAIGDIAVYDTPMDSIQNMVRTRIKADLDGWQLYQIGADLRSRW